MKKMIEIRTSQPNNHTAKYNQICRLNNNTRASINCSMATLLTGIGRSNVGEWLSNVLANSTFHPNTATFIGNADMMKIQNKLEGSAKQEFKRYFARHIHRVWPAYGLEYKKDVAVVRLIEPSEQVNKHGAIIDVAKREAEAQARKAEKEQAEKEQTEKLLNAEQNEQKLARLEEDLKKAQSAPAEQVKEIKRLKAEVKTLQTEKKEILSPLERENEKLKKELEELKHEHGATVVQFRELQSTMAQVAKAIQDKSITRKELVAMV